MATFSFKYQTLLEQRQRQEDQVQRELAKLLRQQMILQSQLQQMQSDARHHRPPLVGTISPSQLAGSADFLDQVQQRTLALRVRLAELDRQIPAVRERLLTAMRARQALELLRDRDHDHWQHNQRRRQAAALERQMVQAYNLCVR